MARTYATPDDLDDWLDTPPDEARATRLIRRASLHIDSLLTTAVYTVDEDGGPVDLPVIEALRDATCAQVAWWVETGDVTGASAQWQGVSAGSVSLTRGYKAGSSNTGQEARTAPEAIQILATAGLLSHPPRSA